MQLPQARLLRSLLPAFLLTAALLSPRAALAAATPPSNPTPATLYAQVLHHLLAQPRFRIRQLALIYGFPYVGRFHYVAPNRIDEWPIVQEARPDVHYIQVGRRRCALFGKTLVGCRQRPFDPVQELDAFLLLGTTGNRHLSVSDGSITVGPGQLRPVIRIAIRSWAIGFCPPQESCPPLGPLQPYLLGSAAAPRRAVADPPPPGAPKPCQYHTYRATLTIDPRTLLPLDLTGRINPCITDTDTTPLLTTAESFTYTGKFTITLPSRSR